MADEREQPRRDRALEAAEEEAEGIGGYRPPPSRRLLESEREEAEGIEVFDEPDATLPADHAKDGAPGHESLRADEWRSPEEDPVEDTD